MNINEISVAYLEEKEQRRRASTVDGYRSSINLYILPEFGNCEIETIEPETIQAWVDSFAKPGAALKLHRETSNYIVETLSCSIGLDGVITIMNTNTVAGIGTGNIIDGELVYLTND